jgi:dihydropyrimidinase
MLHCEDHGLVEEATRRLVVSGQHSLRHYPESRPVTAEITATQRAIAIAEETGAAVYIVHLSSARALEACLEAQMRGLEVYVETRPLYLHLTADRFRDEDRAKYVAQPPMREQADVDALWAGLRQGAIHTFCTDHAPWLLADKLDAEHGLDNVRPGVANLQTSLPMLFSEGVRQRRISLRRFVEVTSSNAARLFGLYPQKGEIAVGSDADLVIFDPNQTRTVEAGMLKSRSDYAAFEGWEVTGWPVMTLRRGEVVFDDGDVLDRPGSGRYLSRDAMVTL